MALRGAHSRERTAERGFTILESMIAMVVFFIGAVGVMGLQLESIRVNRFGGHMTQAMMYADEGAQSLLVRSWDDPLLRDTTVANNPGPNSPFPLSTATGTIPDVAESAAAVEGITTDGTTVAAGSGDEQFQRYWMIADEDLNASIPGSDAKRIRVVVRFRDLEAVSWREVGVTVVKAKVQ